MADSSTFTRRVVTFPRSIILWVVVSGLLPLLLAIGAAIDAVRWLATRKRWITVRLIAIGWVYLSGQVAVIVMAALQSLAALPFGRRRSTLLREWTYWLQRWWVRALMASIKLILQMRLEVANLDAVTPGPIILLFRHASILDNLLPYAIVADQAGIRLRWVLKKELLGDPALDVGGNRTPNYFVDRNSATPELERQGIAHLGTELEGNEGIMLFPEGTRYSRSRFERRMEQLGNSNPELHEIMKGHDLVLPPRSGGVLALMDSGLDFVFAAHSGLEDLRGIGDIWRNAPVGQVVRVTFRRVSATSVPVGREDRVRWLHKEWAQVDTTVRSLRNLVDP